MKRDDVSLFSHLLFVSGLLGIIVGMGLGVYQMALHDPILFGGQRPVPTRVSNAFVAVLATSFSVLVYATVLDSLFRGWFDIVTGVALLGQWGLPIGLYLSTVTGIGAFVQFLAAVCAVGNVLVAVAVLGNYLRRCWPAP